MTSDPLKTNQTGTRWGIFGELLVLVPGLLRKVLRISGELLALVQDSMFPEDY